MDECGQCQQIAERPGQDWSGSDLVERTVDIERRTINFVQHGYMCTECGGAWSRREPTAAPWTITWDRRR